METKDSQRRLCLERRKALSVQECRDNSARIAQRLMELPELHRAHTILSYLAVDHEADLDALRRWAWNQGKVLAFPVSYEKGRMEARIPDSPEALEPGKYGILAPVLQRSRPVAPEALEAVLLPCVGFDRNGHRLGHGGGYYDRYLPLCSQAVHILAAFEAQALERVVTEPFDQPVDMVVTEAGVWRPGIERP